MSGAQTFRDERYSYGIGRHFPIDWTDEQVSEWNNANCTCPFHASQRQKLHTDFKPSFEMKKPEGY